MNASYLEFTNNFYAERTILEGLKATARIGITTEKNDADSYYPANHTKIRWITSCSPVNMLKIHDDGA